MEIKNRIVILAQTPDLLEDLIQEVPQRVLTERRGKRGWSIHAHACHLYEAQKIIIQQFREFKDTQKTSLTLPEVRSTPDDTLLSLNLNDCLIKFSEERMELIKLLETFTDNDWENTGGQVDHKPYNPKMFLRHLMMLDHLHLYKMEELWLSSDEYIK